MVPESVLGWRRLLLGGFVASVAALTELAALWPGDVVDDVLAPPSLRTIIDELDIAYWWPTECSWPPTACSSSDDPSWPGRSPRHSPAVAPTVGAASQIQPLARGP